MTLRRAAILTGHTPLQRRRPSILWLSDHLQAMGWHVTMITVGYSRVSRLVRDRRLGALDAVPAEGLTRHGERLDGVFGLPPIHPFSLRHAGLDALARPLHGLFPAWWRGRLGPLLEGADLVVVESGPPVMLLPLARAAAPGAALVYRVSDDMALLGLPAWLSALELRDMGLADRVSVASPILARRFAGHPGLAIDPIGVAMDRLAIPHPDPYGPVRAAREAVCAGTTQLDLPTLAALARSRPGWRLHVLGRLRGAPPGDGPANLILHGERPYDELAAHVRHADIGLAPYLDRPGVEYQTAQSNRMLMYRHFGLPILGPRRLMDPAVPSILGYDPDDPASLEAAALEAERRGRGAPDPGIEDWGALARRIAATPRRAAA